MSTEKLGRVATLAWLTALLVERRLDTFNKVARCEIPHGAQRNALRKAARKHARRALPSELVREEFARLITR
jgi:hypothetical protein